MKNAFFSIAMMAAFAWSPVAQAAPPEVVTLVSTTTDPGLFPYEPNPTGAQVYTLFAGRHIDAGKLYVFSTGDRLVVTYETSGAWTIKETHLEIALNPADFPQTKKSSAIPGHFAYGGAQASGVRTIQYVFTWGPDVPTTGYVYVAAHAVVKSGSRTETAWSFGPRFGGANWFTYSIFERRDVNCDDEPDDPSCPS